jgi:hypothetical protein
MYRRILGSDRIEVIAEGTGHEIGSTIPPGHPWWPTDESLIENAPIPQLTLEEFHKSIEEGVDAWLDSVVKEKGYRNIGSAVGYAGDPDEAFNAEGTAARDWRSAVYRTLYTLQANPPSGVTTLEQVIAILPQPEDFGWQRP